MNALKPVIPATAYRAAMAALTIALFGLVFYSLAELDTALRLARV